MWMGGIGGLTWMQRHGWGRESRGGEGETCYSLVERLDARKRWM